MGSQDKFTRFYAEAAKNNLINKLILEKLVLFRDYEVPLLVFDERVDLDVVSKTFQYLNAKGTPLSLMNLISAKTYAPGIFDLYDRVEGTQKILEDGNFTAEDFTGENLIRSIAIYNDINNNPKDILEKLKTEHLIKDYKKAEEAYIDALVFINDDIDIPLKLLPYPPLLVPLTAYFMKKKREEISSAQNIYLKQWFWRSSFNNRYGSEAASMGVVDFNNFINAKDMAYIPGLNRAQFQVDSLMEAPVGSATGKAVLGLLQARKPLDLHSNIDLRIKGIKKRKRSIKSVDKHHIFPKDYLKTKLKGNNKLLVDSVCNIAWVSQNTNLLIANTPPSKYFRKLQSVNEGFRASANQQFIMTGDDSPIWSNNYKKFLKARAELIFIEAKKLCDF